MADIPHLMRPLKLTQPTMKGADVEAVRRAAIRFLKDDAAWKHYQEQPQPEAQTFGEGLKSLVERVQAQAGLVVDGIAGPRFDHEMWATDSYDSTAKKLLREYEKAHTPPPLYYPQANGHHQSICQDLHETGGIPGNWAKDFCAPGGTVVVASFDCKVTKLSGHDPATGTWLNGVPNPFGDVFGWSVYLERFDGVEAFLTHLGQRYVAKDQKLKAGQVIGTVGHWPRDPGRSHTHEGITSPKGSADAKRIITEIGRAPKVRL